MARATCFRCAGPAKRPLAFDRDYASKRRSTEDPKSMALTAGIREIGPSASCWRRRIPSTSLCGRKLSYLRYNRSENTQKHRPEVSFDLYDDDDGPGSEPPPQDRLRLVSVVTPSHRRSPAAVGKPSFFCFSAAIVTSRLCRPNNPADLSTEITHRCNGAWKIRRPWPPPNRQNLRNRTIHL